MIISCISILNKTFKNIIILSNSKNEIEKEKLKNEIKSDFEHLVHHFLFTNPLNTMFLHPRKLKLSPIF